jgi:hypothetical protein
MHNIRPCRLSGSAPTPFPSCPSPQPSQGSKTGLLTKRCVCPTLQIVKSYAPYLIMLPRCKLTARDGTLQMLREIAYTLFIGYPRAFAKRIDPL